MKRLKKHNGIAQWLTVLSLSQHVAGDYVHDKHR